MELVFESQTGSCSRYWGTRGGRTSQHVFGRRALTQEERLLVGGGDDGGDCGAGGDCGSGSGSGDAGADAPDSSEEGVVTVTDSDTVTIIGHTSSLADSPTLTASQSAQFGSLLGGATGIVSFVGGLTASATLGEAISIGVVLGGIIGIVSLGVVISGLALAALVSQAIDNSSVPGMGPNTGSGGYGGGDGGG